MIKASLIELFDRDLKKLIEEINLYKDEDNLWKTPGEISNSAGNLCLHLVGNLNYFIGAALGKTGYVRYREDEFGLKNIPRQDLILNINNVILIVQTALDNMLEADFDEEFPIEMFDRKLTNTQMLMHLNGHLSYHLGQINYHRRLLD